MIVTDICLSPVIFISFAIAMWIYFDAEKRGKNGLLWALVYFFIPFTLIFWLLTRPRILDRTVIDNNELTSKTIYKMVPINRQKQQSDTFYTHSKKPEISYPVRQAGIGPSAICSRCGNETSFLRYFSFGGQMLTCAICGFKGRVMKDSVGRDVII